MCRKQGPRARKLLFSCSKQSCTAYFWISDLSLRVLLGFHLCVKLKLCNQNIQILKLTVSSKWIENAENCNNLKPGYCAFIQQIFAENTPGKVPGSHSFMYSLKEHLMSTLFLSLGYCGDKKNNVTDITKLNLNEKSSQSTKKQILHNSKFHAESLLREIWQGATRRLL